mgnify:FL=1
MNLIKKIGNKTIILYIGELDYKPKIKTDYVSITQPISKVNENMIFVDAITATKKIPPILKNCIFVSSPNALTELRLAIKSLFYEKFCEIVIFDDVTSMKHYNDLEELTSFLNSIIEIARESNKKLVLILNKDSNELINDLIMFSDIIIQP